MEEVNIYYCSNKSALNSSRSQSLPFLNYIDKYVFMFQFLRINMIYRIMDVVMKQIMQVVSVQSTSSFWK